MTNWDRDTWQGVRRHLRFRGMIQLLSIDKERQAGVQLSGEGIQLPQCTVFSRVGCGMARDGFPEGSPCGALVGGPRNPARGEWTSCTWK
ncbi:hypothetical protein U1Q18_015746 [Sarracenia purpurea var. burkii]